MIALVNIKLIYLTVLVCCYEIHSADYVVIKSIKTKVPKGFNCCLKRASFSHNAWWPVY